MKKITILEVWNPCERMYIPLKQAINQGLFNTETYLFFDPIEKKYYSITEAAKLCLFKSAIDLRPQSLIVERVKIAQTVALLSARDPHEFNRILPIREAISRQIIDTNLKIYRNNGETIDLGDAISKDLVQVETVKEVTEKITETLTEEKSSENLGLFKKIETSSTSSLNQRHSVASVASEESSENVQEINGVFVMDIAKSVNVSKHIQKNSEQFTAGYVTESNTEKILNDQQRPGVAKTLNPIIDLNEAIKNDIVILPDSHLKTQNVKYVLDLKTGDRLTLDEACNKGIIDVFSRVYIDTRNGRKINLFEALGKFYIVMKEELYTNYSDIEDASENNQNCFKKLDQSDILTVFNPKTGEQVNVDKAISLGLYDKVLNKYVDFNSRRKISLEEAAEKGMVVLKINKEVDGYQFLYINGVINPVNNEKMQLTEAIDSGILDYVECEIHDPQSGQTLSLLEAYDKGLLLTSTHNRSPIVRKKILKNLTETTVDLINDANGSIATAQITTKTNLLINTNQIDVITPKDFKVKKNGLMGQRMPIKSDDSSGIVGKNLTEKINPVQNFSVMDKAEVAKQHTTTKSQSQSPFRAYKRDRSFELSAAGSRGKSVDRASISSRASLLSKFKDKLFRNNSKTKTDFNFDENLILKSIRILDTDTQERLDLKSAISRNLARPEDTIYDSKAKTCHNLRQAFENSVLRFIVSADKCEYLYRENSFIFGESIYLIKYVLDPTDQKKLSLKEAFNRLLIDEENWFYYGKKGPYPLETAIQKGYIACQTLDLNLLNAIIASNIFKYSTFVPEMQAKEDKQIFSGEEHSAEDQQLEQDTKQQELSNGENEKRQIEEENRISDLIEADLAKINNQKAKIEQDDQDVTPKANWPARSFKTEVMSMEKLRNRSKKPPELQVIEKTLQPSNQNQQEQSEEEFLPRYLAEKLANQEKRSSGIYDPKGVLSVELLRESKVKFRENKSYVISYVLDELKDEYISLKRALKVGIINDKANEFVNSKTGDAISIPFAIKLNKIKISEVKESSTSSVVQEAVQSVEMLETDNKSNYEKETLLQYEILPVSDQIKDNQQKTSNEPDVVETHQTTETIRIPETDNALTIDEAHVAPENPENGSRKSSIVTIDELIKSRSPNFNLIDVLLFKKPSNGKYIRFDKVVKNNLYNPNTGRIKDLNTNEYITLTEAFTREVVRINDPEVLYDKFNVYKIESVQSTSDKLTLGEAIRKRIINRRACTYKFLSHTYTIDNAMKEGLVQGLIVSNSQLKALLDDYVKSQNQQSQPAIQTATATLESELVEPEKKTMEETTSKIKSERKRQMSPKSRKIRKSVESLDLVSTANSNTTAITPPKIHSDFSEFYIFDPENEMYISINDAISKGVMISQPIRVVEPNSGGYISLKDAVIKGLVSTQKSQGRVSLKNRSCFHTCNRISYIIDAVIYGNKQNRCSLNEATRLGIFKNGNYTNVGNSNNVYSVEQAIKAGFIVGRKVDLDEIEELFCKLLSLPPPKPTRGVYPETVGSVKTSSSLHDNLTSEVKTPSTDTIKFVSDYTLSKHSMEQMVAKKKELNKISFVKDCKSGRYLSLEEALQAKIINFSRGFFVNTLSGHTLDIPGAIEAGLIVLDYQASNLASKPTANRTRSLSQSSRKTVAVKTAELDDSNIIKVGRQFVITAILDTANKIFLDLDEAIKEGIFDINSAMYINPKNNQRYTLVDAIDQGYVKIADENFRASYKLVMEEENPRTLRRCIKTYPIRYVVHSVTKQIVPINVAVENNLIDIHSGTYIGYEKNLPMKIAYAKYLALTVDDLDRPDSDRAKFKVAMVKKSTTGKNMSVKSALAKNWLNFDRRVYIDKQTNQEIPFSQAVDMDLLILIANLPEELSKTVVPVNSFEASLPNKNTQTTQYRSSYELASSRNDYGMSVPKSKSNTRILSRNV